MRTILSLVLITVLLMITTLHSQAQKYSLKTAKFVFEGNTLDGWKGQWDGNKWMIVNNVLLKENDNKMFDFKKGDGVLVNGSEGKTTNLVSDYEFGDCYLKIDFCVPKDSNSGVYFQGLYEVQVFDSYGKDKVSFSDCGGIYARFKDGKTYEGHPPKINASKAPGEWQRLEAAFLAPRFDENGNKTENAKFMSVMLNGNIIHSNVEVTGGTRACMDREEAPKGPLMLQGDHGPVAYRNIIIFPLEVKEDQ